MITNPILFRLQAMVQSGLVEHWYWMYSKQTSNNTHCYNTFSHSSNYKRVTLQNIEAVFYLMFIGLITAMFILFIEIQAKSVYTGFRYVYTKVKGRLLQKP